MSVRWGLLNKFYVSLPASSFLPPAAFLPPSSAPRRTPTATAGSNCSPPDLHHKPGSECSLPDLHRKLRIRMFPAGPPPRSKCSLPDLNASSRSECSPPDPTKESPKIYQINRMPEIMSKDMLYIFINTYNYIYWNARCNIYIYIYLSIYSIYLYV